VGELEEGLECRLNADEISWDVKECNTNKFKIDDILGVKVIYLDKEQKRISVSLKQFILSPTRAFYDFNKDKVVKGVITKIDDTKGVYFKIDALERDAFIHWSELAWANIYPISQNFFIGNAISARVISFKVEYDSIQFSCKRCVQHQFNEFLSTYDDKDEVEGEIVAHFQQVAVIQVSYKNLVVQAYIHKSKISICSFINDEDIPLYLPLGVRFSFEIERINEKNSIIEVSRKAYLDELEEVELGESFPVFFTKSYGGKCYFYSNDLEGYVYCENPQFKSGDEFEVIPINTSSYEFIVSN
jgi:ribosomal protein S1